MAIKGKGKTKSRPPVRAPRRAPVAVPTPFTRRRWVQILAALLVGAGIVWFLIWLTNGIRQSGVDEREAATLSERRAAAQGWKDLVEGTIPSVGTLGAAGEPPAVASELGPTLEALADGGDDVVAIEGLDERLTTAADRLEAFALAREIRGKFELGDANALTNSQDGLVRSLRTYASATRLALTGAELPTGDRTAVLDEARTLARIADAALEDAWNDYGLGLQAGGLAPGDPAGGAGSALAPSLGG